MNMIFQIDPNLEVPIYQQLVDKIRSAVRMGALVPGQQLPTVQEVAQSLSIARGTIKRAYDELEHLGVLFLDDNLGADTTAKAAGMQVCGVYDDSSKDYVAQIKAVADFYIYDFLELLDL